MPTFHFEIVTPVKMVYSGPVESLRASGADGGFGVLARHLPMVASLDVGPLVIREESGKNLTMATSGGFAEVLKDRVTILAETVEREEEIDVSRAEAARERARERLAKRHDPEIDSERAEIALIRALNRLRIAGSTSGGD